MNDTHEIRPGIDLSFLTAGELKALHAMLKRQADKHPIPTIAERSRKAAAEVEKVTKANTEP